MERRGEGLPAMPSLPLGHFEKLIFTKLSSHFHALYKTIPQMSSAKKLLAPLKVKKEICLRKKLLSVIVDRDLQHKYGICQNQTIPMSDTGEWVRGTCCGLMQATCKEDLRDRSAQTVDTHCPPETEVADQAHYLTQSQHTDTGPTCPSTDPQHQTPGMVAVVDMT